MIYTHVAVALIAAGAAFAGAWEIQNWRMNSNEKDHIELHAEQERDLHALERKRSNGVIAAQNVARTRETKLRADATGSRDALVGLYDAADVAVASAATDAIARTAAAFGVVLKQCGKEYIDLAEIADRHASDIQTLSDAWPKE